MTDAAPAVTPAKKAKKPAAKAKSTHPKYIDMVVTAIKTLGERSGSSRQAISKYIVENYKVGDSVKSQLKMCLKRGVASGVLVHAKGQGASGSFKVAGKDSKAAPKKAAAKSTPKKKPVAKKAAKPKTPTKKAAAKKVVKPKKAVAKPKKSPAKKPVAKPKKSPPKKAAKAKKPAKK